MTKFRSGKRKDGSKFVYPIKKTVGDVGQKVRMTKVSIEKHNPWGKYGQRDIKRERDLLPEVQHDRDFGWLAHMEKGYYKRLDEDEKAKITSILKRAKGEDNVDAVLALGELESEYPDIYENFVGKKADMHKRK